MMRTEHKGIKTQSFSLWLFFVSLFLCVPLVVHGYDDYRNALLYSNLAKVQEAQGHKLKAIDSYEQALAIAPLNIPILQSRANLYFELGNYKKAIIDYGKILDKSPQNIEALQASGYIIELENVSVTPAR